MRAKAMQRKKRKIVVWFVFVAIIEVAFFGVGKFVSD